MKNPGTHIKLSKTSLNIEQVFELLKEDHVGGIELFIGTVRNHNQSKEVVELQFSAYEPMAIKEMQAIANYCLENFEIEKIVIQHAIGSLKIGDLPVIIGVSSIHREAAQLACKYAINTLKETVPIWKKEFWSDGSHWINARP